MQEQSTEQANTVAVKRIVIEELRRLLDKTHDASTQLDSKLYALLQSASLIIALAGLTQISVIKGKAGTWFWIGFAIVLVLYVAIFVLIFLGIRARTYTFPVSINWNEIHKVYMGKDEDTVMTRIISDSLRCYEQNSRVNHDKSGKVHWVMVLFVIIIVVLLITIVLGIA